MKQFLLPLCLLVLTACQGNQRVSTPYGEIPDGTASIAQRYTGSYKGVFRGRQGKLVIALEGNVPRVSFEGVDGRHDILGAVCNSTIGNIQAFWAQKIQDGSVILTDVEFGFDPGQCQVKGRDITMSFKHLNGLPTELSVSILQSTYQDFSCDPRWDHDLPGGPDCRFEEKPIHITGKFTKE